MKNTNNTKKEDDSDKDVSEWPNETMKVPNDRSESESKSSLGRETELKSPNESGIKVSNQGSNKPETNDRSNINRTSGGETTVNNRDSDDREKLNQQLDHQEVELGLAADSNLDLATSEREHSGETDQPQANPIHESLCGQVENGPIDDVSTTEEAEDADNDEVFGSDQSPEKNFFDTLGDFSESEKSGFVSKKPETDSLKSVPRISIRKAKPTPEKMVRPALALADKNQLVRHFTNSEKRRPEDVDVFFSQSAYRQVMEHLCHDTSREYGGILYGYIYTDHNGKPCATIVEEAVPAEHSPGQLTNVAFTEETWAAWGKLEDERIENGWSCRRVGWYHSHPNFGLFLSGFDIDVCNVFENPAHVALVVDPIRCEGGFFVRGNKFRTANPQGFFEMFEEKMESVVEWTNCRIHGMEIKLPPPVQELPKQEGDGHPQEKDHSALDWGFSNYGSIMLALGLISAMLYSAFSARGVRTSVQRAADQIQQQNQDIGELSQDFSDFTVDANDKFVGMNSFISRQDKVNQQIVGRLAKLSTGEPLAQKDITLEANDSNMDQQVENSNEKEELSPAKETSEQKKRSNKNPNDPSANKNKATNPKANKDVESVGPKEKPKLDEKDPQLDETNTESIQPDHLSKDDHENSSQGTTSKKTAGQQPNSNKDNSAKSNSKKSEGSIPNSDKPDEDENEDESKSDEAKQKETTNDCQTLGSS